MGSATLRVAGLSLSFVVAALSQDFSQRGFLETRALLFPQTVPGDGAHTVGEALLRYEAVYKPRPWLQISGALDARADTHQQTERRVVNGWDDRSFRRPALAIRRFNAAFHKRDWTVTAGKQLVRWGKTDILNPTDRFAPRDYIDVFDTDFLGITAARLMYDTGMTSLDVVYVPRFTPSRIPLIGQRWASLPQELTDNLELRDAGGRYPGGPQLGMRWSRTGARLESSLCFYEGYNHLPLIEGTLVSTVPLRVAIRREYPKMRMVGGDAVWPLPWFTVKTEAAWFGASDAAGGHVKSDEYVQYVVQIERLSGEWVFAGGYAGEAITTRNLQFGFAPDRGFTRAFLVHAGYTIDARRSAAADTAMRQNGEGLWLRFEYSQTIGQNWRATGGLTLIRGDMNDFLGRYRRNSHVSLTLRYSF